MTAKQLYRSMVYCFAIFLALIPFSNLLTIFLINITAAEPITNIDVNHSVFVGFFSMCILPAVIEELVFRGILQTLSLRFGAAFAIIAPSLVFTAMHIGNPVGMPAIFLMSIALSATMFIYCNIRLVMFFHFINNCFAYAIYLFNYYQDANFAFILTIILYSSVFICSIIILIIGRAQCPTEILFLWKRRLNMQKKR